MIKKILKTQSFIITITCLIIFLTQAFKSYESYLRQETGTKVSLIPFENLTFPDITICPNILFAYNHLEMKKHGSNFANYLDGNWTSNDTNTTPEELFYKITYRDSIEKVCLITATKNKCFKPKGTNLSKMFKFNEHNKLGVCATLSLGDILKNDKPKWIMISTLENRYIHVHGHNLFHQIQGGYLKFSLNSKSL